MMQREFTWVAFTLNRMLPNCRSDKVTTTKYFVTHYFEIMRFAVV